MIVGFFGVPCVGKGVLVEGVHTKALGTHRVGKIKISDLVKKLATPEDMDKMKDGSLFHKEAELRNELATEVERQYAFGAEVVLLDGFPRFDDQLKWLVQVLFDHPLQIFQILAPNDFELWRRASARKRDVYDTQDIFNKRVDYQRQAITGIEKMLWQYAVPYSSVINDYIDRAIVDIHSKINWPRGK